MNTDNEQRLTDILSGRETVEPPFPDLIPNYANLSKHFPAALHIFTGEIQDPIPGLERRIEQYNAMTGIIQTERFAEELTDEVLGKVCDEILYYPDELEELGRNLKPGSALQKLKKKHSFEKVIQISASIVDLAGNPHGDAVKSKARELDEIDRTYGAVEEQIDASFEEFKPIMTGITEYLFRKKATKAGLNIDDSNKRKKSAIDDLADKYASTVQLVFEAEAVYRMTFDEGAKSVRDGTIYDLKQAVRREIEQLKREQERPMKFDYFGNQKLETHNNPVYQGTVIAPPLPNTTGYLKGLVKSTALHNLFSSKVGRQGKLFKKYNPSGIINPDVYPFSDYYRDMQAQDPDFKNKSITDHMEEYDALIGIDNQNKP